MDRLSPGLGALLSLLALCSFLLVVREQTRVVAGWLQIACSSQTPAVGRVLGHPVTFLQVLLSCRSESSFGEAVGVRGLKWG